MTDLDVHSAAVRIPCALGFVLILLTTSAWGQSYDGWFRVSWAPEPEGATRIPRIEATVHNDSRYRVTDVQLRVDGLSADNRQVGQRVVWALGDIAETIPGAVNYRITVVSFDLVSVESP